jgi:two-component system heavy metal sensor histidine kinase CusS
MTTWLTLYYTVCVFVLLSAASAFLYWGLEQSMDQEDRDIIAQKMQVLSLMLQKRPPDRLALEQEVRVEGQIAERSRSPFLSRVLDQTGQTLLETPRMSSVVPASVFPDAVTAEPVQKRWRSSQGVTYLLGAATVSSAIPASAPWRIQAALNVSSDDDILVRYRWDILIVLVGGLLGAAALGAWITRRGLRPITDITRATERIGAQHLTERIKAGPWPKELLSLAVAFDGMLDRLQDAFERLSQFSADLAHELRTPINNLIGETEVALTRGRPAEEYVRVLQSALEEHGRLARMIDSMLFLAQTDQARAALLPMKLDARAELQAVADFYQALAEEQGVQLICEGQATIVADPLLLRRALSNLLSNALKYTSRDQRVILRASGGQGSEATLSVVDSGIGIATEHLSRLGDRFYRVDPSRADSPGGAGLGLAIVKSIVALHGGRLLIESTVGKGTTVSWVFPTRAVESDPL